MRISMSPIMNKSINYLTSIITPMIICKDSSGADELQDNKPYQLERAVVHPKTYCLLFKLVGKSGFYDHRRFRSSKFSFN